MKTNVLLERTGIKYENLSRSTKDELAKIPGVDSVISGQIKRENPMSTGAAIFSTIFIGFSATNKVMVNMAIHDGASTAAPQQTQLDTDNAEDPARPERSRAAAESKDKPIPWPKDAVEQVRAVADLLATSPAPLSLDEIEARFTGRGPWKKWLPQLLEMLVALGRAEVRGDNYVAG